MILAFRLFNELPEDRFEAFLSVPLVSGGRLVGVVNVQNRWNIPTANGKSASSRRWVSWWRGSDRGRLESQNLLFQVSWRIEKISNAPKGSCSAT